MQNPISHWNILKYSLSSALKNNLLIYSGYATYTTILAMFPFVIFLVALSSLIADGDYIRQAINLAFDLLPREVAETLMPTIQSILETKADGILTIAFIGTIWAASSGVEGFRDGLNVAWQVTEKRSFIKRRAQGIVFMFAASFAFLLLAAIIIIWPMLEQWLGTHFPFLQSGILDIIRYSAAFALLVGMLTFTYTALPYMKGKLWIAWRQHIDGAIIASCLWIILAALFSTYLAHFGSYSAYGNFASFIVIILFIHFSLAIALFGAYYNCSKSELQTKEQDITAR